MTVDRIESTRTYFAAAGHEVDAVFFARTMLVATQAAVQVAIARGLVAREALEAVDVVLGDPRVPVDPPVTAYVNDSEWKAKCECGGVEYVDLEMPVFMCCGCWNRAAGHAWRRVVLPNPPARAAGEALLLARPDRRNRNWHPERRERVSDLRRENRGHRLPWRSRDLGAIA